jgi:hypothetical protein
MVPNEFQRLYKVHSFPTNIYLLHLALGNSSYGILKLGSKVWFRLTNQREKKISGRLGRAPGYSRAGPTRIPVRERQKERKKITEPVRSSVVSYWDRARSSPTGNGTARRWSWKQGKKGSTARMQTGGGASPRPPQNSREALEHRERQGVLELGVLRRARTRKKLSRKLCLGGRVRCCASFHSRMAAFYRR